MVRAGQSLPHLSLHVASFTKVKASKALAVDDPTKPDYLEIEETTQVILKFWAPKLIIKVRCLYPTHPRTTWPQFAGQMQAALSCVW